jgi:hypothetical protein
MKNQTQLSKLVKHLSHEQLQELVKLCKRKLQKKKCKNKDDQQQVKMAKLKKKRTILNHCITACVNDSKQKPERFKIEKFGTISDRLLRRNLTSSSALIF